MNTIIKPPEVVVMGHPALKQKAQEVEDPREMAAMVEKMMSIMRNHRGVGLAANQIGQLHRVIVYSVRGEEGHIINPVLDLGTANEVLTEGCLSIPGMAGDIERAVSITAEGWNIKGDRIGFKAEGLLARVLQHETDHLNGTLIVDRAIPGTLRPSELTRMQQI